MNVITLKEKADVILLTKDSMKPCLKQCVRAILDNVPVNRILVVDGGSVDETLPFLKGFSKVEVIDDTGGNRGSARQKGISAVETEWHLHVDSDVVLCENWYKLARRLITPEVGAICGAAIPGNKHMLNIAKAMAKFYGKSLKELASSQPKLKRYLTINTMIRTEAVKDIQIPPHLHIWEDQYLGMHIVNQGYKWIKTLDPWSHHIAQKMDTLDDFAQSGVLAKVVNAYTNSQVLFRLMMAIPKSLWIFAFTGDYVASKNQLDNYIGLAKGWFSR